MDCNYNDFCKEENGNLPYGTLTLFFEITVVDIVKKRDQFCSVKVPEFCLNKDRENVFERRKFCDITLLVGGRDFQIYKNILSERSNVFAAIFDNEYAKSKRNRSPIINVDHDVFEEILIFMYTGRTKKI
ncbi:BTB/POZ domain,SKP1/BTB/POZ domain [Cinara cedri]|uniref:BTB/POZ domain,SKP1/BTB/POZ domain n=1 Tax=Cinara cedri TaxID=506608 RepID=A0A5E4M936_9HEMI|nr:BTB/POZ domain,SKP1/BTB/POZ domain [Cinara cedri]